MKPSSKPSAKNPSAATNKGNEGAKPTANTGSRKHDVFVPPILLPGPLQQRAGSKSYFANSPA